MATFRGTIVAETPSYTHRSNPSQRPLPLLKSEEAAVGGSCKPFTSLWNYKKSVVQSSTQLTPGGCQW